MSEEKKEELKTESDLQDRIDGFNKELTKLLEEYELGIAAVAKISQNGTVVAHPTIVDIRGKEEQLKQQEKPEEKITNPEK